MEPSTAFFRNRYLLFLLVAVILINGFSALQNIPRLEDPVITTRNVQILTPVIGADASRVEALVAKPIERQLRQIPEVRNIESTSRNGFSVVAVELLESITDQENDAVFSEVRDKLAAAEAQFPQEALEPIVADQRGAVAFTILVSLSWEDGRAESLGVLGRYSEELAERFRNLGGTDYVERYGVPSEEILIDIDPHELAALGIDFQALTRLLQSADTKVPAGFYRDGTRILQLEVGGEFDSTERLASVPLAHNEDGSVARLGDIATITRATEEPPTQIAFSGNSRRVYVAARVREDQRVDQWARAAQKTVESFEREVGERLQIDVIFNQNDYTSDRLGELAFNLFLGACVIFVVVIFTMGWRSALMVGSALPLVACLVLFVVSAIDGKLHQMSIFGMIIALGLLIDNAIVVTDEVNRKLREGKERIVAVRESIRHLFVPLLSSTITTMLAFMPILLLPGNAGDFVGSIGSSVVIAIGSSFFVAMTIIAALTGRCSRRKKVDEQGEKATWWRDGIGAGHSGEGVRGILSSGVKNPWISMPAVASVSMVGFALASTLGAQFFPRVDRDMFEIQFWLPNNTAIEETQATAQAMEAVIRGNETVRGVHWLTGASFPSVYYNMVMNKDNSAFFGQGIVYARDFKAVKQLIPKIQSQLDTEFPEAQALVRQFAQGPPTEGDVEFRILGPDFKTLKRLGEEVRTILANYPTVLHSRATMETGQPRLRFEARESDVQLAGLRLTQVAAQLQGSLVGFIGGSIIENVQDMPARVQLGSAFQESFAAIQSLPIPAPTEPGQWIPLNALGELTLTPELGTITRRNARRMNSVRGWVLNDALPIEATRAVLAELDARGFELPPGYELQVGGDAENQSDAVGNLLLYAPVLVTIAIATIILAFRSVRLAALLFLVGGLATGWGLLATWCMGFPLSFNTILGLLGLVGLAFNDNIVVLAAIRADREARVGDPAAIGRATSSTLRHLVSTTLTTVGGFLPLLIFVGGDFWPPLAIVLTGGVFGATLLAMFFTPAAYRLLRPWKPVTQYFS